MAATRREYMRYTPYRPQTDAGLEPKQRAQSEYIPYNLQFQKLNSLPSEKVQIDESDYATYLPLWAEISSPSSETIERTPIADDYTPYTSHFAQPLPSPPASPPTPPTARPVIPRKSSRRESLNSQTEKSSGHIRNTSASFLPRFQPVPQPKSSLAQQQNASSSSSYSNFFCRECGCPLADRYGLHDLDDEKEEYKSCLLNAQTKEWARSLEMLKHEESKAKISIGKERKHPRNLPKIDTGVANYYRTGMQQRY